MTSKPFTIWQTATARAKLKEIYVYSVKEWGKKVTRDYMAALQSAIEDVANGIKHPKINPNFSTRFSYITCKRHYIFFEYQGDKLIIATLFHASMSVEDRIGEEMPALKRDIRDIVQ